MDATPLNELPDDVATLRRLLAEREAMIAEQHETIHELQRENQGLSHRLDVLLRRVYGPSSERMDPDQLLLFGRRMAEAGERAESASDTSTDTEAPASPRARRKGHGRRPLPDHLPRHRVEHPVDPAQRSCPCCGGERQRIGEAISEQLDYVPASLFVLEHVRPKLACKRCEEGGVATARRPAESQLIEKGLPGPGVVAQVIVSKHLDHLPLYRQERIFSRFGVELARSTMCGWMAEAAHLLEPLVKLMGQRILDSKVIHTDDTPVPVQEKGRGKTRTGRFWVYLGDADHPYTVYDYTPSRSRDGPLKWLDGYEGYLQADAFAGYDELHRGGRVIEVGCWAHARRKFYDARTSDAARSHHVLGLIRQLYAVEKRAKDLDAAERTELRQQESKPVLEQLQRYLLEEQEAVLPQSPMGEAITYTLNQWEALVRYADDGDLAIDNNAAERAIRPLAIGRKNYLFVGSDAGGRTAAILYSLVEGARRAGLDVWLYLRDLLTRLPSAPMSQLPEFLPDRWHHPALDEEPETES
jgi:transposase